MKIDRAQFREALLNISLYEFREVPPETQIEYEFSEKFQDNIRKISRRSEQITWRVWQSPLKRAILIAVLVMLMLAVVACSTPVIRNAFIDFFFVDRGDSYGITFDPDEASAAPKIVEDYLIPDYEPESYTLAVKEINPGGVTMVWANDRNEFIMYIQSVIPEKATSDTWIGINAEGASRTSKIINGYRVEIISSAEKQQYIAVWTDNRYLYIANISIAGPGSEAILEEIMTSLTRVEKVSAE